MGTRRSIGRSSTRCRASWLLLVFFAFPLIACVIVRIAEIEQTGRRTDAQAAAQAATQAATQADA